MWSKVREFFIVSMLYLLITLIFTFPLALHISDYLAGGGQEAYVFLWDFWWFKKAIVELRQNPYYTDYLFYPKGETLFYFEIPLLYALLSIPLQSVFGPFAAYNLLLVLSFTLAGVGMYLLLLYLTRNRIAAFVGGAVFTFAPFHVAHAMGHFHMVIMEWVPFYVLCFLRYQDHQKRKDALLAALFLAFACFSTLYFLFYCFLFSFIYVMFYGIHQKHWRDISLRTFHILWISVLFMSPKILPMMIEALKYDYALAHNPEVYSADILSFLIPGEFQTIGAPFASLTGRFTGNNSENANYLGYVVIFLSGFAVMKYRQKDRRVSFFAFLAAVFFVLSLGMHLHVAGKITPLPLPYMLANRFVPGFAFSGAPERIQVMTMFCLATLSAFAIRDILTKGKQWARALLIGALFVLCGEYSPLPFPLSPTWGRQVRTFFPARNRPLSHVPEFYRKMANDPGEYALLDAVNGSIYQRRIGAVLYYQTVHQKKILGGTFCRDKEEARADFMTTPVLAEILWNEIYPKMSELDFEWRKNFARQILQKYEIRYVILPQPSEAFPVNRVPEFYGLCRIYEDQSIIVYQMDVDAGCLPPERKDETK